MSVVAAAPYVAALEAVVSLSQADTEKSPDRLCRLTYEFDTAGVLTDRGRVYQESEMAAEIRKLGVRANEGKLFGFVDHPRGEDIAAILRTDMKDAATRISTVEMISPKRVRVVHDVMDTEAGRHINAIVRAGGKPGTSQRAVVRNWRKATKAERDQVHQATENTVIGEGLRLVTYDLVTDSGIEEASTYRAVEDAQMKLTADDVKTQHPEAFDAIKKIGVTEATDAAKAALDATVKTAIESAKPAIVDEATAPLKTKVAALEGQVAAMTTIKTALESAGIIAKPADPAAAGANDPTVKAALEARDREIGELRTAKAASDARLAALESGDSKRRISDAVRAQFGSHAHIGKILIAAEKGKDEAEGLKLALEKAKEIEEIVGSSARPNHAPAGSSSYTPAPTSDARKKASDALNCLN